MVDSRRLLGGIASVLLAIVVFVVSGEGLARALDMVDRLNGYRRVLFTAGPDADLPYRLRPGVRAEWAGTRVRVNALGLRGPETTATPAPGVRRLLVLGDSVVFGQGVSEDEAVAACIAAELAAADGRPVEALNAGVQGYDAIASARTLELLGPRLQPSLVVYGLSLNDYDRAPAFHPLGVLTRAHDADASLADRSELVLVLRWLGRWMRGALWQQQTVALDPEQKAGLDALVRREHLAAWSDPDASVVARVRMGLIRMRDAAGRLGVPLLVAIFPESYQVGGGAEVTAPQQRIAELCADAGVQCLDLLPAFASAGGELFLDAQHPNARGHATAGAAIAAALTAAES